MSKPVYLFSISSHPDAISINSLAITFLKPTIDFSKYDYFIVTSKQTSEALKQYLHPKSTSLHSFTAHVELKPALCVSVASAKSYESLGGEGLDIGAGYGDNLVDKIKEYPNTKKWLYLRAKVVASDFVSTCRGEGYDIDEAIVYESDCSQEILDVHVEDNATLIFTSPSSLKCFLKNSCIKKSHSIIVIGKTTAKALPENVAYKLSSKTTIKSCFELIR
jgi:uroporphyrinogen-III synthase